MMTLIKTKMEINQLSMDTHIGILTIGYIVWIVGMNWMYIKEYLHNTKGVIKRGTEWPD